MFDPSLMVQQTNPGERFAQAFQQGMQVREQNIAKAAMAALARDPSNAKALDALAGVDPQAAMQFQQQQQQTQLKALDAHRDSIKIGAQIIRAFKVKDEASYQQAKQFAAQNGVDISQLPPSYDAGYVANVIHLADALDPEKMQGKDIPVQQGGSVLHVNPDGTTQWTVMPSGPVPQPLTDAQIQAMEGGQAPQAPGGFL